MMAEVAVVKARTSEKEYIVVYIGYLFQYAILDFFFFFGLSSSSSQRFCQVTYLL